MTAGRGNEITFACDPRNEITRNATGTGMTSDKASVCVPVVPEVNACVTPAGTRMQIAAWQPMMTTPRPHRPADNRRILLLLSLVLIGLAVPMLDWCDWRAMLQWARGYAQYGWLVAVLILLQVVLFMFALPGSSLLWVVGSLYPPAGATLILVSGASLGGLAGYGFARWLTASRLVHLRDNRHILRLQRHSDLLTLFALRLMPGFPHSLINYGAGMLHLPLGRFLLAAVLGIGIKSFLYTSAIHHALEAAAPAELLGRDVVLPLLLLAILTLLAGWIRHLGLARRNSGRSE